MLLFLVLELKHMGEEVSALFDIQVAVLVVVIFLKEFLNSLYSSISATLQDLF